MNSVKYKVVKKKLWLESAVIAAIIAGMAAVVWFLGDCNDGYLQKSTAMEGEVNSINSQTQMLREKFTRLRRDKDLFQDVMLKDANHDLTLTRQVAYEHFNQFKSAYYLNDLSLVMGAVKDETGAPYKRPSNAIVSSDLTVDLTALSDEHIYSMLDDMERKLPGSVRFTSLSVSRNGTLTSDVLRQIADKGSYALVKATIKFTWFGIKPTTASDTANAPKH